MIFLHILFLNMSGLYSVSSYLLWESVKYYLDDLVQKLLFFWTKTGVSMVKNTMLTLVDIQPHCIVSEWHTYVQRYTQTDGHKYIQRLRHLVNELLSSNGADGGTQGDADSRDLEPAPFTT